MQLPLINEHLFSKYFVRLSLGNETKGFATYGCFQPYFLYFILNRNKFLNENVYFMLGYVGTIIAKALQVRATPPPPPLPSEEAL